MNTRMMQINDLNHKTNKPDLLDLLGSMSEGALSLFVKFKNTYDWKTGTSYLLTDKNILTDLQFKHLKCRRELHELGLVRRLMPGLYTCPSGTAYSITANTFMISPEYLLPVLYKHNDICYLWRFTNRQPDNTLFRN